MTAIPPNVICSLNDGTKAPGFGYVNARRSWKQLLAEYEGYAGLWLHHPMGIYEKERDEIGELPAMRFNQLSLLRKIAEANPDNLDIQARADFDAFLSACQARSRAMCLILYIGSPWTMRPLNGQEKIADYAQRLYDELWWVRAACPDVIAFDNSQGPKPGKDKWWQQKLCGPYGAEWHLHRMLMKDGFQLMIEPTAFEYADRYHDHWVCGRTETFAKLEAANWKHDKGDLRPVDKFDRVFEIVNPVGSEEQKNATIQAALDKGHHAVIRASQMTEKWRVAA